MIVHKFSWLSTMTTLPIGVFGGTFDPIHLGHIYLATTTYKLCNLKKVLLIPCYQSPLKTQPLASAEDRFNMIQLAIKNLPFLELDSYEIKNKTVSYTIKTLKYLRKQDSIGPLVLIMSTDAFDRFDEWYDWQKILDFTHLLIVTRPNYKEITNKKIITLLKEKQIFNPQELQKKAAGSIYQIDIKPPPISATEIRALIKQKKDITSMVNKEVWRYINDHRLYVYSGS